MPPVRMRQHGRAKKGTMKQLIKKLFKEFPAHLILSAFCIVFNVFGNLCSSIFAGLISGVLTSGITETYEATGSPVFNPMDFSKSFEAQVLGGSFTIKASIPALLLAMGTIYFFGIFASWGWTRTMAIVTQKFMNKFRIDMFSHMQDLPIKYFDTHPHGAIMSLYTNDIDTIRQFISQTLPEFLRTGLSVLFCLVMMLINSVWMTLVVLAGSMFMFLSTKIIGGKASKYFIKQQMQTAAVEGNIEESINGLKVIKVFNHEDESIEEFSGLNEQLRQYATTANMHGNITGPINNNIGNLMYVLTALIACLIFTIHDFQNLTIAGGLVNLTHSAFFSMVVSFLMMTRMFTNNINQLSQQVTFIVLGMAGASRCFDLLEEQVEEDSGYVSLVHITKDEDGTIHETEENTRLYGWKHPHGDGSITYTELKGDILLDNVDFGYVPEKLVLHNISIFARPGEQIALVGATGAGKTTITNLINRFYPLADGKVRYDGININKIKKGDLRRSLGIVLQDVNLFTGTVMENIRYGKLDATDEEVYEAAKIANAYDFIMRLPEGFNTMLTGDGANLSQGQRQLISIARAAVADAPVMILDEATSSIDTRTEKLVQDGMTKLMEGRTVFVIAHRLSTIQHSDAIMVLENGRIIERGNHKSLIAENGMYYQLYTGAFELE